MLKKVTTNVTYKVPAWNYCRLVKEGKLTEASKNLCRFCIKDKHGYRCALYNMPLAIEEGIMPVKAQACSRATAGFRSIVEDVPETTQPVVDVKDIMKAAVNEYAKLHKQMLAQGYPEVIADKIAREYTIGGK